MSSILDAWNEIETWLKAHAPKIMESLNPPATTEAIGKAEAAFGFEMPKQWKDLYLIHNGMNSKSNLGSLFYGFEFYSLETVMSEYRNRQDLFTYEAPVKTVSNGVNNANLNNLKWIPFLYLSRYSSIWIDMDPAAGGNIGQVIFTDHGEEAAVLLNGNILEFMNTFVGDLRAGLYFLDPEALEDGNHFLNAKNEIDIDNWRKTKRWGSAGGG